MREHSWKGLIASSAGRSRSRFGAVVATAALAVVCVAGAEAAASPAAWITAGSMSAARAWNSTTPLANGKVLAAGGMSDSSYTASADIFDPSTGNWSPTGNLSTVRAFHTSTSLPGGRVLVAGGTTDLQTSASAELYAPGTGSWGHTGSMISARRYHTATLLPSGKVLVAGGVLSAGRTNTALASAELYDPATGNWTPTGSMRAARSRHTATLLSNGKVLVSGGVDDGSSASGLASAELYDPATGRWSAAGAMRTGRVFHTAVSLQDGRVLVAGGDSASGGSAVATAELYNPRINRWSPTSGMSVARALHAATVLSDGRVLETGGVDAAGVGLASSELFDPRTGRWGSGGSMSAARLTSTATLLPNGKALVAGGQTSYNASYGAFLSTSELFAPTGQ